MTAIHPDFLPFNEHSAVNDSIFKKLPWNQIQISEKRIPRQISDHFLFKGTNG